MGVVRNAKHRTFVTDQRTIFQALYSEPWSGSMSFYIRRAAPQVQARFESRCESDSNLCLALSNHGRAN